jgi:type III restriction enzyme
VAIEHDPYPLPDILTIMQSELKLSPVTLLQILKRSGRMGDYMNNPERFMEEAVAIIRDCKAEMVTDGIRYQKIAGEEYSVQEIFDKEELLASLDTNAVPVERSVYDHIVTDSPGVERRFAKALDDDPDVKLFFKLPDNFKIDTPLGTYNPDWAVLLNDNGRSRLYFVLETKGSTRALDLRGQESIKIECGRRHFEALGTVDYAVTDDWKKVKLGMASVGR